MSLPPGTRFAQFEILAPLGAGGMGEVYRARDTKLQREVALKVLSNMVSTDADRLARFEREAVALAALNHPHIAQLYGTVEGDTGTALVMELVDGEDLAAVLARGALPIDDAIAIARHVADALDAAHTAGIIHRDLKPANIKRRADGVVKVLDFGLAKLGAGATDTTGATRAIAPQTLANSPTMTGPAALTTGGMILGTAAYMSPEQARGRSLDKRTDIWAFGCLLFELLTGKPAFGGDTVTDVLGSIVKSDPDWSLLPATTPPSVAKLLRRCLQKDLSKRLRDIGDAIVELDAVAEAPAEATASATRAARSGRQRLWIAAAWLASVAVVAAAAAALAYSRRPAPEPRLQKFQLSVQNDGGAIRQPMISPDGRQIAYVGRSRIWVQSIDQWKPRELPGTEEAARTFWSPAGDWIAYFRSENLFKVPAGGGPVVRIARVPSVQSTFGAPSGVWREDGTIVISMTGGLPPMQVSSGGGELTAFGPGLDDSTVDLHNLSLLPGGSILAGVHRKAGVDAIGILSEQGVRIVLEASNVNGVVYSPSGHIVYDRAAPSAGLWAVAFSLERLEAIGEPFLIGEGVDPSIARDGTLAFLGQSASLVRQLAWITMDGQVGARLAEPREWTEGLAISPDGGLVLASANDGIWSYDVETGVRSRVTTGSTDITPAWVGRDAIVFVRTDNNEPVIMLKQLGGTADERVLVRRARFPHVTRDGRRVSFNVASEAAGGAWQVGWIDLDRPSEVRRLGSAHDGARFPSISPDGRLVAYISGEVGRDEVFLTTLPSGEGKWQLSTGGGGWTRITPRGDAVVYRAPDASFMSVPISMAGSTVKVGQPKKLFDWGAGWHLYYDLTADGLRGIVPVAVGKADHVSSISVVQHWEREFATLRR